MTRILYYLAFIFINELLPALAMLQNSMEAHRRIKRIIGGKDAGEHQSKSIVSLRVDGKHYCAGVLIKNPKHNGKTNLIMTNTHCLAEVENGEIFLKQGKLGTQVVIGASEVDGSGLETASIDTITAMRHDRFGMHPNYEHPQGATLRDIAILPLDRFIEFSRNIKAVDLATSKSVNMIGTIVGWGSTDSNAIGAPLSAKLQYAVVATVDPGQCKISEADRAICIYGLNGARVETADGDSGGPFYVDNRLQGIIMGDKTYKRERRIVIASIFEYLPWIQQTIAVFNGDEGTSS